MRSLSLALLFLVVSAAAHAANPGYLNFATCKTAVDGIPFVFDFFEEVDIQTGAPKETGYAMQTMGDPEKQFLKSLVRIDVSTIAGGAAKTVNLYAFADPDVLFATFTIDMTKNSEVEVFAKGFGAVWAKISCVPFKFD